MCLEEWNLFIFCWGRGGGQGKMSSKIKFVKPIWETCSNNTRKTFRKIFVFNGSICFWKRFEKLFQKKERKLAGNSLCYNWFKIASEMLEKLCAIFFPKLLERCKFYSEPRLTYQRFCICLRLTHNPFLNSDATCKYVRHSVTMTFFCKIIAVFFYGKQYRVVNLHAQKQLAQVWMWQHSTSFLGGPKDFVEVHRIA